MLFKISEITEAKPGISEVVISKSLFCTHQRESTNQEHSALKPNRGMRRRGTLL